jgi:hypothetical protein
MVKSEYYRRQADLCIQLALLQRNQKAAIWLMEFAEELMSKAEGAAATNAASSAQAEAAASNEAASAIA